ncbi:hypothetical protein MHL30_17555 [Priestia flexa]|uniref:hypothetical protein n=1 Tax=Priestia flexa TaxID=86664 RepID=UPI001EF4E43A|nr:hypothetical protein [Priestia flexa]MCG7314928.1 hypothetical protein [Priestia flexa]
MLNNTYRDPGKGAISYADQIFVGKTRDEISVLLPAFLNGDLNEPNQKRIKRCDYCNYWFYDESLRNTKRTCCDDCKTSYKTLQTAKRRAEKALFNPKPKKERLQDLYLWWLEYPFWANEYAMLKIGWKFERPMSLSRLDYIHNGKDGYGTGNKRKTKGLPDYHGDKRDEI